MIARYKRFEIATEPRSMLQFFSLVWTRSSTSTEFRLCGGRAAMRRGFCLHSINIRSVMPFCSVFTIFDLPSLGAREELDLLAAFLSHPRRGAHQCELY